MKQIKYFQAIQSDSGKYTYKQTTKEETTGAVADQVSFGMMGKDRAKFGQRGLIYDLQTQTWIGAGKVENTLDGRPYRVRLDNGDLTTIFGLILEIISNVELLILAIKAIFDPAARAKYAALKKL